MNQHFVVSTRGIVLANWGYTLTVWFILVVGRTTRFLKCAPLVALFPELTGRDALRWW